MISQLIGKVLNACFTCLVYLIFIPCGFLCILLTGLTAPYENGQEAASLILDHQFDRKPTQIEFIDEPPVAAVPGGASESSAWIVLELKEKQTPAFEHMIQTSTEWQEMPLSEELYTHKDFLSPPATINGIERKESLPVTNENGYYLFSGEIPSQEQRCRPNHTIAIYDPETRRLYIYTVSY